ncbi:sulfur carrier protein ThiS [Thiomicrospira cyclica]|uniref:Thiamine biosynthesis protein ThiS n=1 Tax=Thiomicrospira cyclica (strain DSM 14477 / JCM 11371 / ALM1) TaxID=717773 RepID=F6DB21_THICA|nr:sulfur carrier protein ThiS [Thiomicrospira cyclica]AEG32354.1 thiamine biosynthesis protein ThiS [Thiomicrospira cyclica ALM1]
MIVIINGEPTDTISTNLAGLVAKLNIEGAFALALNENFVPKSQYADTPIAENDRIEIVAPMQGG